MCVLMGANVVVAEVLNDIFNSIVALTDLKNMKFNPE